MSFVNKINDVIIVGVADRSLTEHISSMMVATYES